MKPEGVYFTPRVWSKNLLSGLIGRHHRMEIAVSFTLRRLGVPQSRSGRWGWLRRLVRLQTYRGA